MGKLKRIFAQQNIYLTHRGRCNHTTQKTNLIARGLDYDIDDDNADVCARRSMYIK